MCLFAGAIERCFCSDDLMVLHLCRSRLELSMWYMGCWLYTCWTLLCESTFLSQVILPHLWVEMTWLSFSGQSTFPNSWKPWASCNDGEGFISFSATYDSESHVSIIRKLVKSFDVLVYCFIGLRYIFYYLELPDDQGNGDKYERNDNWNVVHYTLSSCYSLLIIEMEISMNEMIFEMLFIIHCHPVTHCWFLSWLQQRCWNIF